MYSTEDFWAAKMDTMYLTESASFQFNKFIIHLNPEFAMNRTIPYGINSRKYYSFPDTGIHTHLFFSRVLDCIENGFLEEFVTHCFCMSGKRVTLHVFHTHEDVISKLREFVDVHRPSCKLIVHRAKDAHVDFLYDTNTGLNRTMNHELKRNRATDQLTLRIYMHTDPLAYVVMNAQTTSTMEGIKP